MEILKELADYEKELFICEVAGCHNKANYVLAQNAIVEYNELFVCKTCAEANKLTPIEL